MPALNFQSAAGGNQEQTLRSSHRCLQAVSVTEMDVLTVGEPSVRPVHPGKRYAW